MKMTNFSEKCSETNIHSKDDENRNALLCIANEIQNFQAEYNFENSYYPQYPTLFKIKWYKEGIKEKKTLIANLKNKLNTACILAKLLLAINENKNLTIAKEHIQMNKSAKASNSRILNNCPKFCDLEPNTYDLIDRAFKDLCDSNEEMQSLTTLDKLKEIIRLCNTNIIKLIQEKNKSANLERRNRFLSTKLLLTENHLQNIQAQTKNVKKGNIRLGKDTICLKTQSHKSVQTTQFSFRTSNFNKETKRTIISAQDHKIKPHLSKMKSLLKEQANTLRELKTLSAEVEML